MVRREVRPRQMEVAVWLVAVGAVACAVAALVLHASNAARTADLGEVYVADVWVSLAVPPVGAYLFTRTRARLLGAMLLSTAALSVGSLSAMYAIHANLTDPDGSLLGSLGAWMATWTWTPYLLLVVVVPLLVPDGRPASRGWRLVVRLALGCLAAITIGSAFAPGALDPFPRLHNPLGIDAAPGLAAFTRGLIAVTVAVFVPLALLSMVLRWRGAELAAERRRAGWVLGALVVLAVAFFTMESVPYPWNEFGPAVGITVVIASLVWSVVSSQTDEQHRLVHEQLVGAREDERFRIHRDLHDGLGPELAGLALHLNAIGAAADDPVRDRLAAAEETLRRTVDEVRRIVDDLRPPALDQLGLVGAVNDASTATQPRVAPQPDLARLPGPHLTRSHRAFPLTLTTTVFNQRSPEWFDACPRRPTPKGQQSSISCTAPLHERSPT